MAGPVRMHQTTIRFTLAIWEQVEAEARREGVSAAQYVRDATVTTLAYGVGSRGRDRAPQTQPPAHAGAAMLGAAEARQGSAAVWAQAQLARDRARATREASTSMRDRRTQAVHEIRWR